jgi:hypothetical protein
MAFTIFLAGQGGDRLEQLERGLELRDEQTRAEKSHY